MQIQRPPLSKPHCMYMALCPRRMCIAPLELQCHLLGSLNRSQRQGCKKVRSIRFGAPLSRRSLGCTESPKLVRQVMAERLAPSCHAAVHATLPGDAPIKALLRF